MTEPLQRIADAYTSIPDGTLRVFEIALVLVVAVVVWRMTRTIADRAYWRRLAEMSPEHVEQLRRDKRQHTMVTLAGSVAAYVVAGAALVAILLIASDGSVPAVFGASLVAVLLGFGLQRVLNDVVAGMLLAIENTYDVGDWVYYPWFDISGMVVGFSLRTTRIRQFNGDKVTILNGSALAVSVSRNGYRDFEVQMFLRTDRLDEARPHVERVCARFRAYDSGVFLRGPTVTGYESLEGRIVTHVRIRVIVPPTMEWLVEKVLVEQLELEVGDHRVGPVQVFNLDEQSYDQYRKAVILPPVDGVEEYVTRLAETGETGQMAAISAMAGASSVDLPERELPSRESAVAAADMDVLPSSAGAESRSGADADADEER